MEPSEEVLAADRKIALIFSIITAIFTILLSSIAVLIKLHWSVVLGTGLIVGTAMAWLHNFVIMRISIRHDLDVAPGVLSGKDRRLPDRQPARQVIVYVEEPVKKDPWIHEDSPGNYK